jgi:hypothetical protein
MWQPWIFGRVSDAVSETLSRLPDNYAVLSDILLPEGRVALDYIVAGPNGLFAIETNDWAGEVKCKGHDWFVDRKRVASPGRAAQRKAAALRQTLVNVTYDGERVIPAVSPVLVFIDPKVSIGITEPAVPAMKLGELASFIMHYKVAEIVDEDHATIVRHLDSFPSRPKPRTFFGFQVAVTPRTFAPRPLA